MAHSSGFNIFGLPEITAALGLTPGADAIQKFGKRVGVANTEWSDLWSGPDKVYGGFLPFGTSGTLLIESDNAGDTGPSGAGCRTIRVYGLDPNYDVQVKDYVMNGAFGVTTVDLWSRVWRLRSVDAQDRRIPNLGTITVTSQAAGNPIMACMPAPSLTNEVSGSTLTSNFTMPRGHIGVIAVTTVGMSNNKVGNIRFIASILTPDKITPFTTELDIPINGGPFQVPLVLVLPSITDVIAQGRTETGNADAFISYNLYVATEASLGIDDDDKNNGLNSGLSPLAESVR